MCTNRFFVPFCANILCLFLFAAYCIPCELSAIFYQRLFVVVVWFQRENLNHAADSSNGTVLNVPVRKKRVHFTFITRLDTICWYGFSLWLCLIIMETSIKCINFRWKCNNAIMHNGHRNKSRRLFEHIVVSWDLCMHCFF